MHPALMNPFMTSAPSPSDAGEVSALIGLASLSSGEIDPVVTSDSIGADTCDIHEIFAHARAVASDLTPRFDSSFDPDLFLAEIIEDARPLRASVGRRG